MLTITIEILCKINMIKLPKSAKYSLQAILTVLLYAATSTSNSSESAINDLKVRNSDKKIPSSDTINNYIKANSNEYILSSSCPDTSPGCFIHNFVCKALDIINLDTA
jgi:hypothetical protein